MRAIDFQKNNWSQTSEVLETSEVFREIISMNIYKSDFLEKFFKFPCHPKMRASKSDFWVGARNGMEISAILH